MLHSFMEVAYIRVLKVQLLQIREWAPSSTQAVSMLMLLPRCFCLQIQSQLKSRGYSVVRQYPEFNRLVVSGGTLAATASTDVSSSPADLAKQVSAELSGLGGVAGMKVSAVIADQVLGLIGEPEVLS